MRVAVEEVIVGLCVFLLYVL